MPLLGLAPSRAVGTKDVGDLQSEAPHEAALRGLQGFQWADHFAQDIGGHLDVVRRGVQALVPQQDLDHANVDLLFQQVGGKAVSAISPTT